MNNEPLFILLADDDESDRILFKEAFAELKIKTIVQTVNDGVQLMEYLNNKENRLPHLLFLDLNMPRKNGIECLEEIKINQHLKEVSIAIYSTSSAEKDMEETFHKGANIYIIKPTDYHMLKQILEKAVITTYQYQHPPFNKELFLLKL